MAFQTVPMQQQSKRYRHPLVFAKGFGSSSSSKRKKNSKQQSSTTPTTLNKKTILQKVQKTYGTSSASSASQQQQQIAKATQQIIEAQIQALSDPWKQAIQLYQQVRMHKAKMSQLSIYQQSQLPESVLTSARHFELQLQQLLHTHKIPESDLHTILQKITWDASADAKTARGLIGTMPADIQKRIDRACTWLAEPILVGPDRDELRCLDVGCGFGTLVPSLRRAGIRDSQIHGVDLSENMIANARALYPDCQFFVTDFWKFQPKNENNNKKHDNDPEASSPLLYHGILFCSSLHDFPNLQRTIQRALSLLHRPGGRLVIVHAQGAGHVQNQVLANPILVPRGLPTAEELVAWTNDESSSSNDSNQNPKGRWVHSPAAPNTPRDREEGYLAVFETIK
jgi:2-polyprenyl-3-methyl-5-hydroxy-6-metoxy-1,4-benzoquinol methylase